MTNIFGYDFVLKFSCKEIKNFETSFLRMPLVKKVGCFDELFTKDVRYSDELLLKAINCLDELSFNIGYVETSDRKINLIKNSEQNDRVSSLKDVKYEYDALLVKINDKNAGSMKIVNGYIVNIKLEEGFLYLNCNVDDVSLESYVEYKSKKILTFINGKYSLLDETIGEIDVNNKELTIKL